MVGCLLGVVVLRFPLFATSRVPGQIAGKLSTLEHQEKKPRRFFGLQTAVLKDVDGDRVCDIAVAAAELGDGISKRKVLVFSGADGKVICEVSSLPFLQAHVGKAQKYDPSLALLLSSGGDIDRDGCDELLIGVHQPFSSEGPRGRAVLYSVRDRQVIHQVEGEAPGDGFGRSVSLAGDVDRDGVTDWIVGAPGGGLHRWPRTKGYAYICSGGDGSLICRVEGELHEGSDGSSTEDLFGHSSCPLGDLNKDGYADFAIGAPLDEFGGKRWCGTVTIYSGKNCLPIRVLSGAGHGSEFGRALGQSDYDLDGLSEIVVGSASQRAQVFSGESGEVIATLERYTGFHETGFAGQVSGLGDVNGDGYPDLGIGALPLAGTAGTMFRYRYYVYSGKDWEEITHVEIDRIDSISIQGCGDIDQDGCQDLLIGLPSQRTVKVVSGASGKTIRTLRPPR